LYPWCPSDCSNLLGSVIDVERCAANKKQPTEHLLTPLNAIRQHWHCKSCSGHSL
jgi:hypothetical protein